MNLENFVNSLTDFDLDDLPNVLNAFVKKYELMCKQLIILNRYVSDLCLDKKYSCSSKWYIKVGVYNARKGLRYHLVSDNDYSFKSVINSNWVLIDSFELAIIKPIRINRFVVDLDYFINNL